MASEQSKTAAAAASSRDRPLSSGLTRCPSRTSQLQPYPRGDGTHHASSRFSGHVPGPTSQPLTMWGTMPAFGPL